MGKNFKTDLYVPLDKESGLDSIDILKSEGQVHMIKSKEHLFKWQSVTCTNDTACHLSVHSIGTHPSGILVSLPCMGLPIPLNKSSSWYKLKIISFNLPISSEVYPFSRQHRIMQVIQNKSNEIMLILYPIIHLLQISWPFPAHMM